MPSKLSLLLLVLLTAVICIARAEEGAQVEEGALVEDAGDHPLTDDLIKNRADNRRTKPKVLLGHPKPEEADADEHTDVLLGHEQASNKVPKPNVLLGHGSPVTENAESDDVVLGHVHADNRRTKPKVLLGHPKPEEADADADVLVARQQETQDQQQQHTPPPPGGSDQEEKHETEAEGTDEGVETHSDDAAGGEGQDAISGKKRADNRRTKPKVLLGHPQPEGKKDQEEPEVLLGHDQASNQVPKPKVILGHDSPLVEEGVESDELLLGHDRVDNRKEKPKVLLGHPKPEAKNGAENKVVEEVLLGHPESDGEVGEGQNAKKSPDTSPTSLSSQPPTASSSWRLLSDLVNPLQYKAYRDDLLNLVAVLSKYLTGREQFQFAAVIDKWWPVTFSEVELTSSSEKESRTFEHSMLGIYRQGNDEYIATLNASKLNFGVQANVSCLLGKKVLKMDVRVEQFHRHLRFKAVPTAAGSFDVEVMRIASVCEAVDTEIIPYWSDNTDPNVPDWQRSLFFSYYESYINNALDSFRDKATLCHALDKAILDALDRFMEKSVQTHVVALINIYKNGLVRYPLSFDGVRVESMQVQELIMPQFTLGWQLGETIKGQAPQLIFHPEFMSTGDVDLYVVKDEASNGVKEVVMADQEGENLSLQPSQWHGTRVNVKFEWWFHFVMTFERYEHTTMHRDDFLISPQRVFYQDCRPVIKNVTVKLIDDSPSNQWAANAVHNLVVTYLEGLWKKTEMGIWERIGWDADANGGFCDFLWNATNWWIDEMQERAAQKARRPDMWEEMRREKNLIEEGRGEENEDEDEEEEEEEEEKVVEVESGKAENRVESSHSEKTEL